jgi:hypothetical protein
VQTAAEKFSVLTSGNPLSHGSALQLRFRPAPAQAAVNSRAHNFPLCIAVRTRSSFSTGSFLHLAALAPLAAATACVASSAGGGVEDLVFARFTGANAEARFSMPDA